MLFLHILHNLIVEIKSPVAEVFVSSELDRVFSILCQGSDLLKPKTLLEICLFATKNIKMSSTSFKTRNFIRRGVGLKNGYQHDYRREATKHKRKQTMLVSYNPFGLSPSFSVLVSLFVIQLRYSLHQVGPIVFSVTCACYVRPAFSVWFVVRAGVQF